MTIEEHERILSLIESEQLSEALDELERLEREQPGNVELQLVRATMCSHIGDDDHALGILESVLQQSPEHPVAQLMFAGALLRAGRETEARKVYEAVVALNSEPWSVEARKALSAFDTLSSGGERPKVAIVCGHGIDTFVRPIQEGLRERFEFRLYTVASLRDVKDAMEWADVCWFEWGEEVLVRASKQLSKTCAVVCRMHSYEVLGGFPSRINWNFVDHAVFVADHVRDIFDAMVEDEVDKSVIHIGIDTDKLTYRERRRSKQLAYLGYINHKKNLPLILQILSRLVSIDPEYTLHVGGTFQELRCRLYFDHMVRSLGLERNVVLSGWVEHVDHWLDDKDYILSTSVFESFGMSIAEGMAKGLKPVVHNWPGAKGLYPEEILFSSVDEAVEMITDERFHSAAYREFVEDHYSLQSKLQEFERLFSRLAERKQSMAA